MYDNLHKAMLESHTATSWFAFSEAIGVSEQIITVCRAYNKEPDEAAKDNLVEIAEKATSFLRRQNTREARFASQNVESCLTTIRNERLIS